jgi:4-alpha-glucanotransferase
MCFLKVKNLVTLGKLIKHLLAMRIEFSIHYQTQWGERVFVRANTDKLPLLALDYQKDGWWKGSWETNKLPADFAYRYQIRNEQGLVQEELAIDRPVGAVKTQHLLLQDSWRNPQAPEVVLHASAFEEVIFKPAEVRKAAAVRKAVGKIKVQFQMDLVRVPSHLQLAIVGNTKAFGNWQPEDALLFGSTDYPLWRAAVMLSPGQRLEYKYVLIDPTTKEAVVWEKGDNRTYAVPYGLDTVIKTETAFQYADPHWKGAGLALPVFSIRTEESFGCGEFSDLKKLVDWSVKLGMKVVQILPVNDTTATYTWVDSYPYAAVSVFALHPLYLSIDELEETPTKAALNKKRKELNALGMVDYEATVSYKLEYARKVYKKAKTKTLKSAEFQTFFSENKHWLQDYAAFCYLRDKYLTPNFTEWTSHQVYDKAEIAALTAPKSKTYDEVAFHYYLQYHLDRQLKAAGDYARSQGVVLKGDIPIGIYRHSADAWVAPELYNMDGQAGAPPDDFATEGQNWGFPTYNWAEMAKTDYQWWRQRFTQLSRYFDAFRIDHILGFFRIWETPIEEVEGIMGRFNPALPVNIDEFYQRGIPFDYHRYCSPYITEQIVKEIFGEEDLYVRETFLQPFYDRFQLREQYATQRQIRAALTPDNQHLEKRLFSLVSNVLFFPVEGSQGSEFHPRIDLQKTLSFLHLDHHTQGQITALYNDYFYHRQEEFWREKGMTKLPAMKAATNMLICGEDLGMVPKCVPEVMKDLGILSLEIQRMAKNSATEFLQATDIPYWSVCSPSTHDMSPLRLWWEEETPARRQRFCNQELGWWGEGPVTCTPELAEAIIVQHLQWPTMWAVFPFQDLLAIDGDLRHPDPAAERINVPAISQHYWRYRMHLSVEELLKADEFNERVRGMMEESGR